MFCFLITYYASYYWNIEPYMNHVLIIMLANVPIQLFKILKLTQAKLI